MAVRGRLLTYKNLPYLTSQGCSLVSLGRIFLPLTFIYIVMVNQTIRQTSAWCTLPKYRVWHKQHLFYCKIFYYKIISM